MKNKSSISKAVLITIAMTSFISCKKTTKTETPVPTPTPRDAQAILVGRVWKISSRVENGGTASLPNCAKDDILEFKTNGTFNSLVDTTLCNPNESSVVDGGYQFSGDKKNITFTTPFFNYSGKIIDAEENKVTIEFDLGPGFLIKDTFVPKQ
jgi:hypothetical protein